MISKESITLVLAIWGAVVSTVAVLWNIARDALNKPKVTLKGMIAHTPGSGSLPRPVVLAVEITNVGKQAVVIKGLASDNGKNGTKGGVLMNPRRLPCRLEAKDSAIEELSFTFLHPGVTRLYVWDSTGKHWYLPKKRLEELIKQAKERNLI
jgi:hypothetical protein